MRNIAYNPGIVFIAINIGWAMMLLIDMPRTMQLMSEDNFIEYTQVFFFALTSAYCIAVAMKGEDRLIRYAFRILAVLSALVVLEEISWGQSILNLETPDFIKEWNYQDSITLHNHYAFQLHRNWIPFVCFGMFGLYSRQLIRILDCRASGNFRFFLPPDSFRVVFGILLINGIAIAIAIGIWKLTGIKYLGIWRLKDISFWLDEHAEIGELGIAFTVFAYTYTRYLLLTGHREQDNSQGVTDSTGATGTFAPVLSMENKILPVIAIVSLWLLAASLLAIGDSGSWTRMPEGEPAVSSFYKVYYDGARLTYVRQQCSSIDMVTRFALHIYPVHESDLDTGRKQHGYNNWDFYVNSTGIEDLTKRCIIVRELPQYDIARIKTGQYLRGAGWQWEGTILFIDKIP